MEDPVAEVPRIIQLLYTAPPEVQQAVVETYFTPTASFTHPFCRTGSFPGSIWLVVMIYRWFKILCPHVDVAVDSVAFDKQNLRLFLSLRQNFKLRVVPFYNAPIKLVAVLQLATEPTSKDVEGGEQRVSLTMAGADSGKYRNGSGAVSPDDSTTDDEHKKQTKESKLPDSAPGIRYWIQSQNDLYQSTEWIKFLAPWGIGVLLIVLLQLFATILCVAGTSIHDSSVWSMRERHWRQLEELDNGEKGQSHLSDD